MVDPFSTSVLIPFLFVFAIVFGVLEVSKVFKNKAIMAIIAFVIAFFAVSNVGFLALLNTFLPVLIWIFVGLFILVFIFRLLGRETGRDRTMTTIAAGIIMMLFVLFGAFLIPEVPIIGKQNLLIITGLFFLILIFYAASTARLQIPRKEG